MLEIQFPINEKELRSLEEKIDHFENLSIVIYPHYSPQSQKEICAYLENQNIQYNYMRQVHSIDIKTTLRIKDLFRLFILEPFMKQITIRSNDPNYL